MNNRLILFIALLLTATTYAQQRTQPDPVLSAMHTISSHDLLEYVKIQCDEKYAGRLTGTAEYQQCAEWLASMFKEWGLTPAGEKGTWFQWFDIPYTLVYPDCGVSLHLKQGKEGTILKKYKYITDYMPGSTSGSGEVTAEVVYAGYGISAPELGYDDYKDLDVRGKIILIEPEAPVSPAAGAEKFNPWYGHSFHQTKLHNAVKHGAVGMLYNYGPIANPNNAWNKDFIYVHIGSEAVNDIFAGTGKSHDKVIAGIRENLKPSSFNTGKTVSIKMTTEEANEKYIHRPLSTNNFPNLGRPRLDAARFLSAGVPSLSFATYGSRNNYHLPGDNIDIINPEILEDMAQLLFMTVVSMGDYDGSLRYAP